MALGQRENQIPYAIYFINKNISPIKPNYTITKKGFLSVVHAINKFRHYITKYEVFVHIDHSTMIFLMNKTIIISHDTRWLLLLQEFNITIIDRPGKDNLVIDFMSRLVHIG